jgi:hypothetical protein
MAPAFINAIVDAPSSSACALRVQQPMTAPTAIESLRFLVISLAGGRESGWAGWLLAWGHGQGRPHAHADPESKCCFWYLFRITKVKASCHRLKSFKGTELEVKTALS